MNELEFLELKSLVADPPSDYPVSAVEHIKNLLAHIKTLDQQLRVARANAIKLPSGVTMGGFVTHKVKAHYGKGKVVGLKYEADLKMELVEVWWYAAGEKTAVPPDRLLPYEEPTP